MPKPTPITSPNCRTDLENLHAQTDLENLHAQPDPENLHAPTAAQSGLTMFCCKPANACRICKHDAQTTGLTTRCTESANDETMQWLHDARAEAANDETMQWLHDARAATTLTLQGAPRNLPRCNCKQRR